MKLIYFEIYKIKNVVFTLRYAMQVTIRQDPYLIFRLKTVSLSAIHLLTRRGANYYHIILITFLNSQSSILKPEKQTIVNSNELFSVAQKNYCLLAEILSGDFFFVCNPQILNCISRTLFVQTFDLTDLGDLTQKKSGDQKS